MNPLEIVNKYILQRGLKSVVQEINEITSSTFILKLRGGYSSKLEIIDNIFYVDNEPYRAINMM